MDNTPDSEDVCARHGEVAAVERPAAYGSHCLESRCGDLTRRNFIGIGVAAAAFPAFASSKPKLRFGLVSDAHFGRTKGVAYRRFRAALEWFRSMEVDAVVCTGDLTNAGTRIELENFAGAWKEVFPGDSMPDGRRVEKVFLCGNHDTDPSVVKYAMRSGRMKEFETSAIQKDPDRIWRDCFGEPFKPVFMKKVKGYVFVASHWTDSPSPASAPAYLESHRAELEGDRPFFYCQHAPLRGTVNPKLGHYDNGMVKRKLDTFPNAVSLTGHSHNALTDETSIWQGEFTAVGAASVINSGRRYSRPWYENSDVPGSATAAYPGRKGSQMPALATGKDGSQGLLVDVFADRIVFHRRSFAYAEPNGPDWVVPLPSGKKKPFAIEERKAVSVPPRFGKNARIAAEERDGFNREKKPVRQLVVSFPAAVGTRSFAYEVTVASASGNGKPVVRYVLSPDFYLPVSRRVERAECVFALAELPPAEDRQITVRACDSFLNKGSALVWRQGGPS